MHDPVEPAAIARTIGHAMQVRSLALGVDLHVDEIDDRRITFCIRRPETTAPGQGAIIIGELLGMADVAGVEVVIDVRASAPRLLRYYRGFGFQLVEGDYEREEAEIQMVEVELEAWLDKGRDPEDLGVVTMHRNRWAQPLLQSSDQRQKNAA